MAVKQTIKALKNRPMPAGRSMKGLGVGGFLMTPTNDWQEMSDD